jgi:hypothetical protein
VIQAPPRRSLLVAAAAAGMLAFVGCGASSPPRTAAAPAPTFAPLGSVSCAEEAYTAHNPNGGWRHPLQSYYAPGKKVPTEVDLQHVLINDAAAVIRYRRDAPRIRREALRTWAGTKVSVAVLPSRSIDAPQLEAFTSNRHLTCDGVDPEQLTVFTDRRGGLQITPHDDHG